MIIFKSVLLSSILLFSSSALYGQTVKEKLAEIAKKFDEMPKTDRAEYVKLKAKAFKARDDEKYLTSLIAIHDARKLFDDDMDLLFLNGVCLAQLQDVEGSIALYNKALSIDPNHIYTLMNLIEINYFDGRFEEAVKYIKRVNGIIDSRAAGKNLPLMDFKYMISLTKLSESNPDKYKEELEKISTKYGFMDDNPFYYYSKALQSMSSGDKQEGLVWILKAYLIFDSASLIDIWNKTMVDTGYIDAHEITFKTQKAK